MAMTITHKTIQHRLDLYLDKIGWVKQRNKRESQSSPRTDGIYKHKSAHFTLVVEVKPTLSTKDEIYRGMGQAIQFLPDKNIKSVLVIPERYIGMVSPVFSQLSEQVGLLGYGDDFIFRPVKNVWDIPVTESEDLSWLEETEFNAHESVTGLICQECGHQWIPRKRKRPDLRRLCPRCQQRNVATL